MSKEILALGVLKSLRQRDKATALPILCFLQAPPPIMSLFRAQLMRTPQFDDQSLELLSYSGCPFGLHGSARSFSLPGVVFEMTIRLQ